MKKLLLLSFLFINIYVVGQKTLTVSIDVDSANCCRTLQSNTKEGNIPQIPVIYSAQFVFIELSGYAKFVYEIIHSVDGENWEVLERSDTITTDTRTFVSDQWDTIVFETTPFVAPYLGIRTQMLDSTQALKQDHKMYIVNPNSLIIP